VGSGEQHGGRPVPLGRYSARLDDKGRLKLPAVFHEFFESFPEKRLFVTSLDGHIAQLYPISTWRENEDLFREYTQDPDALETLTFNAHDLGAEADLDAQGRVTINSDLRSELKLQGTELHLIPYRGHVQLLPDAIYQAKKAAARAGGSSAVKTMEKAGMK
jgi:MraZ protein